MLKAIWKNTTVSVSLLTLLNNLPLTVQKNCSRQITQVPHSGASANAAVFLALLNAGDKILGMSLDHGGHLTHGSSKFLGKIYESYSYGIDAETGDIDYAQVEALARSTNQN